MTTRVVDLRSDTLSLATDRMRLAMQQAEVGDSQKHEDPSVNRLQEMAAEMLGKEAALYIPSGTMGNLAAVLAHTQPGDRVVVGQFSHLYTAESDGMTRIAGVMPQPVSDVDGIPSPRDVEAAITPRSVGRPYTTLISIENTHNQAGGAVATPEEIEEIAAIARRHGVAFHIDGARIFNAATALELDVADLVAAADSVTFCLSKGLCAPAGSVLVGSEGFIERAHRIRKQLGGGMRQVGVLAAAGLIALEEMTQRLADDHENARLLAEGLAEMPQFDCDVERVQTNMVFFELRPDAGVTAPELAERLRPHNILMLPMGERRFRAVTHYWIRHEHVIAVLVAIQKELA
jgi:threonine aldolase